MEINNFLKSLPFAPIFPTNGIILKKDIHVSCFFLLFFREIKCFISVHASCECSYIYSKLQWVDKMSSWGIKSNKCHCLVLCSYCKDEEVELPSQDSTVGISMNCSGLLTTFKNWACGHCKSPNLGRNIFFFFPSTTATVSTGARRG